MIKPMRMVAAVTAAVAALAVAGCSTDSGTSSTSTSAAAESASTVTITHPQGEAEVVLNPTKAVVLDFAALDTLDALGVSDSVIAKPTTNAEFAADAAYADVEVVGSMQEPDIEAIAELDPEVIIIGGRTASHYETLNEIAPTVDVSTTGQTDVIAANAAAVRNLAAIYDKTDEAEAALADIDTKLASIKSDVEAQGLNALIIMTNGGNLSAYGAESRFGLIHQQLGYATAADVQMDGRHGEAISFEYVADANPDVLFVVDRDAAIGSDSGNAEATLDNDLIRGTKAAQDGRIVYLSSADWYIVGGGLTTVNTMIDEAAPSAS